MNTAKQCAALALVVVIAIIALTLAYALHLIAGAFHLVLLRPNATGSNDAVREYARGAWSDIKRQYERVRASRKETP